MNNIGGTLKQIRENCGLTIKEASRKSGISEGAICHYETGKSSPTIDMLEILATTYQTTLIDIYKGNLRRTREKNIVDVFNNEVVNKLSSLVGDYREEQDIIIRRPSLLMLEYLILNMSKEDLKALYEYCFYPSVQNPHLWSNISSEWYDENIESQLSQNANKRIRNVFERIRKSRAMANDIISWSNTKQRNYMSRVEKEFKQSRQEEEDYIESVEWWYKNRDDILKNMTPEDFEEMYEAEIEGYEEFKRHEENLNLEKQQKKEEKENHIKDLIEKEKKKRAQKKASVDN